MRIGMPYEIYRPIVAIEVAAAKATDDPREGRAKQKDRNAASQTVLMGERNLSSTLWNKCGYHVQISTGHGSESGRTYNSTISRESKHHPRVRSHGEQPTMPYTNHNQAHEHHSSIITEDINEDLEHRLSDVTRDCAVKILDAEKE